MAKKGRVFLVLACGMPRLILCKGLEILGFLWLVAGVSAGVGFLCPAIFFEGKSVMSTSLALPPIWESIEPVFSRYDVIFCDIWGVLHNGREAWPKASAILTRFRAQGGKVVLVSNAPRPGALLPEWLAHWGVKSTAWDEIVTSGDVTRRLIEERGDAPFLHIGPARDKPLLEGLGGRKVEVHEADYIICSGLYHDETETPDDYAELLGQARARQLDMICANPDLVVERGDQMIYCAGALAQAYEQMGGRSLYAGKPHPPIYAEAQRAADQLCGQAIDKTRILAIGDAFMTDVAGASGYGVDCLLVARGIHTEDFALHQGPLSAERVARAMAGRVERPVAVMDVLA
jgi:HAD superfamily hydrolase (TIGR01459 family)